MSDSLASNSTLVTPSNGPYRPDTNGQASQASDQPQSNAGEQPSEGQVAKKDFQALQSRLDAQIAAQKQEAQAARQEAQAARQQAQMLQQRLQQMEDSAAPDDYTRMELRLKRAEETAQQYASAYQQTVAAQQEEATKRTILLEIVEDFDLVKVDDLLTASSTIAAVKLATKLQKERENSKQRDNDDKRERNLPDIGGGAPYGSNAKWEEQYAEAMRRKDTTAIMRLNRLKGTG